jgi:hypothetical protein
MGGFAQMLLNQARRMAPAGFGRAVRSFVPVTAGTEMLRRIPTAFNPLATRTPTTLAGKAGKMFNPLNPVNFGANAAGMAINAFIPENNPLKGNIETFSFTPGGLGVKLGATAIFGAVPAATGTLDAASEMAKRDSRIRPQGTRIGARNSEGDYWAGEDWGYQSPESFNKIYGTTIRSGGSTPPPAIGSPGTFTGGFTGGYSGGQQAGQQTFTSPPVAPQSPGSPVLSNGAGVPAQRQNVQERALSQEVLNAAQQYSAPSSIPLSSFYEGQQQLGRSLEQTGELQRRLKEAGGAAGMTDQALMQWAQANPALAYRELLKREQRIK